MFLQRASISKVNVWIYIKSSWHVYFETISGTLQFPILPSQCYLELQQTLEPLQRAVEFGLDAHLRHGRFLRSLSYFSFTPHSFPRPTNGAYWLGRELRFPNFRHALFPLFWISSYCFTKMLPAFFCWRFLIFYCYFPSLSRNILLRYWIQCSGALNN